MPAVILLTGRGGQVGHALEPVLSAHGRVVAVDLEDCNMADIAAVRRMVESVRPDIIVNSAAYTQVNKAESEQTLAFAVNETAPGAMAEVAKELGAAMIHYSTDYVFDGLKPSPYHEDDTTNPLSVYGASKLGGEIAVRAGVPEHFILRTSWVFGAHGTNFLKTMLHLAGERDELSVVADQFGAPTPARLLAEVTGTLVEAILADSKLVPYGTYHLTSKGETSWHGFASFTINEARRMGMPVRASSIRPIPTDDYPTRAARPANSRLDTTKLRNNFALDLPTWQTGVTKVLEELACP